MPATIVSPGTTRIGWIGTGVMGASMCGHLLARGFSATIFNRTRSKAEPLLAQGAAWAASPREVAQQSDVVFTIVGFPRDVREVILGEHGVLAGSQPGNIVVDMTTSQPSLAIEIAAAARAHSVESIDAPVSGGDIGGARGAAVDHDRRRPRRLRGLASLLGGHGQDDRLSRRTGRGSAHEVGQSDVDRRQHGRRVRGLAVRLPGRIGSAHRAAVRRLGRRRQLVAVQPGTANHPEQLRPPASSSSTS